MLGREGDPFCFWIERRTTATERGQLFNQDRKRSSQQGADLTSEMSHSRLDSQNVGRKSLESSESDDPQTSSLALRLEKLDSNESFQSVDDYSAPDSLKRVSKEMKNVIRFEL